MRRDMPAARIIAEKFAVRDNDAWAFNDLLLPLIKPPTPMLIISLLLIFKPASKRSNIQSTPFNAGDRAQPGRPMTGQFSLNCPSNNRFPGSTGMPRCVNWPPAFSIPVGITSRRSAVADAPMIKISLQSASCNSFKASAMAVSSCSQRRSSVNRLPRRDIRVSKVRRVLLRMLSRMPGNLVCIRPTSVGLNVAMRKSASGDFAMSSLLSTKSAATP